MGRKYTKVLVYVKYADGNLRTLVSAQYYSTRREPATQNVHPFRAVRNVACFGFVVPYPCLHFVWSGDLNTLVVKQWEHLFGNEEKLPLHQSDWNGVDDGLQDAHSGGVRQCLFPPAFVLLRFEGGIGLGGLLLGVMNRTIRFGANPPQFALVDAV
jgi:hypothetical protein